MIRVAVLGATGSIGGSALDVIARHPERYRASVLASGTRVDELIALCRRHRPDHAVIADPAGHAALREGLAGAGLATEAHAGGEALARLAAEAADTVIAAIVGAAGVPSVLAAAEAGRRILLANKEAIVVAGDLVQAALSRSGGELLPVDSEHNALFQCLPQPAAAAGRHPAVRRIVLTASGGPFRGRSRDSLRAITPDEACAHPNWTMGRKISVDSATLMNKGLEVIEAHWLFGLEAGRIEVVVHPQSLVHSLVDYVDGSTLAQLGLPDMRTALAYGLAWPERIEAGVGPLDLISAGRLDFEPPDLNTFPALAHAFSALRQGIGATTVLNAANEVAVSAFLQRRMGFLDIADCLGAMLDEVDGQAGDDLTGRLDLDARTRRAAADWVARRH
ncbi:1-deoxy-D-xylulose-5-phosphate reductoisomerase [Pseudomarimonas salicorniae]|uniref:1-deoxy-D-xylulose 5-phosphate reductoisomerase n=1 Tax=Pseudomarimonas salicorniae TaxID=2933270 RepID=A0ABT0GDL1_9GAMM|nr:1-deoxy-D-xylulose-5-phosphate reductoisomerase [Lysobacter sp. CAU 1642]